MRSARSRRCCASSEPHGAISACLTPGARLGPDRIYDPNLFDLFFGRALTKRQREHTFRTHHYVREGFDGPSCPLRPSRRSARRSLPLRSRCWRFRLPRHAQAVRGTLLGSIADTSGSAVPGATVTVTDQGTNISSTTVTNQDGFYTFPNLKDGIYRVEAELAGFKKVVRENVRVDVNTTIRVDLTLEAGADHRGADGQRRPAAAADRTAPTPAASSRASRSPRCRSASAATSRAWSPPCPAPRGRSGRTPSSSTRRTRCRRTSTASRASPTTSRSRASTTTTAPAC